MLNNLQIVLPILTSQAPFSHFMTYGGSKFIKMIQKNNKITGIFFTCAGGGGGQDKPAWTACPPPGVKITRVGGKLSRGQDELGHRNHGNMTCPALLNLDFVTRWVMPWKHLGGRFIPIVSENTILFKNSHEFLFICAQFVHAFGVLLTDS